MIHPTLSLAWATPIRQSAISSTMPTWIGKREDGTVMAVYDDILMDISGLTQSIF
jgi:hypothetical protein